MNRALGPAASLRPTTYVRIATAFTLLLLAACALCFTSTAFAQGDPERAQRLEFMKRTLEDFQVSVESLPKQPLPLTPSPVLRFSNPVRDASSDGAIFLWLAETRPVAAASVWIRNNGESGYDFASLTDQPLQCVRDGQVQWSPRQAMLVDQPFDNSPAPGRTAAQRLAQMRRLAARFAAEIGAWPAEGLRELRLMPRPLYRYTSPDEGIVDGAIFALALANDPEVLIQLELARDASGNAAWAYSLARMSALRMKVRLDEREIWAAGGYYLGPRSVNDAYIEVIEGKYVPRAE